MSLARTGTRRPDLLAQRAELGFSAEETQLLAEIAAEQCGEL
jgi:hypothetical protein